MNGVDIQALLLPRRLREETVSLGCSRNRYGVALYDAARRLLDAENATDFQYQTILTKIFLYAEQRQQRLPPGRPFTPRVIDLYERLEAFQCPFRNGVFRV